MTPHEFADKWQKAQLTERAGYQQHFLDLCDLLGQPHPAKVDPEGKWFAFEKGVTTSEGKQGFADVWLKGKFGWEYKAKHKNLDAAYQQLQRYREALENPPLLIVCDLNTFVIHTNFTNYARKEYRFTLADLTDPRTLNLLRLAFTDPEQLRPDKKQEEVTEEVARQFGVLARGMSGRGVEPHRAAHFLMQLVFCMFAEDIGLLEKGLFTTAVGNARRDPARLTAMLADLLAKMAGGGYFGAVEVDYFNGGLFETIDVVPLAPAEIELLHDCALRDWGSVEPSIFGTLFERILDPGKRAQLGAHYTSRVDIETLLRPVFLDPLRREWEAVRADADELWEKSESAARNRKAAARKAFENHVNSFLGRLDHVTVLDPACGSGNFLYVALSMLLDLEKEVRSYLSAKTGQMTAPAFQPTHLMGLELNAYARELAQVVIWIGYLQWQHENGYPPGARPILPKLETIRRTDAVLDLSDPANPREPQWPDAEFIVGNPPFLGGKMLRSNLGDDYVDALFKLYGDRVRPEADLCCYWFEKALVMIRTGGGKACWIARHTRHTRWGEPGFTGPDQGDGGHLLRRQRSGVGSGRGGCPHQHGRVRRRDAEGTDAGRQAGRGHSPEPDFRRECHAGSPAGREPERRIHGRYQRRAVRHPARRGGEVAPNTERQRPSLKRRDNTVVQRAGRDPPQPGRVDHRLWRWNVGATGFLLRLRVRVSQAER
jgi:hypothetical protein